MRKPDLEEIKDQIAAVQAAKAIRTSNHWATAHPAEPAPGEPPCTHPDH